ncbi:MAG: hypothetical protein LRY27_04845 [Chitinophagales bacterium]|nr:hypothetical protein [Chitinophagales bacterium]
MTGFIHLHSFMRWLILIALVWSIFSSYKKWKANDVFTKQDNTLNLVTFIFAHVQLLLGLALYFMGNKGMNYFGMEDFMKNSMMRFFAIEHIFGMLIAIGLITFGRIKMKKLTDATAKHKTIFIYYLIALLIILVTIPWPFRGFGNGWI